MSSLRLSAIEKLHLQTEAMEGYCKIELRLPDSSIMHRGAIINLNQ